MPKIDIAASRLSCQQIENARFKKVQDLVSWMGAMQAQDYEMSLWAVGVRLPGSESKDVQEALNKGEILRTHLLRPTWHLVSARDIYWMLALTAPHIKSSLRSRYRELELSASVLNKSNSILEKALANGKHLTRNELLGKLEKAKISVANLRGIHFMLHAELDGIVCNGAMQGKKQTYALLCERTNKRETVPREEALARLAVRYFTSHAPATLQDFAWWSGLPAADARHALEQVKPQLISEKIDERIYWFPASGTYPKAIKDTLHLLPAYDEFVISYKNRSASMTLENHGLSVTINGIFKPLIVVNGQVIGTWKRTIKRECLMIEPNFFHKPAKKIMVLLEKAAIKYGAFYNQKAEITSG